MQTASTAAPKRTPLHDVHVALSAKMVEFGGWYMPVQYGPILDEVRTVRTTAGLFDLSHMGRVLVRGKDRIAYLDRICTNFVAKIPQDAIRYSLFCKENGMPIDDLLVYKGAEEVFLCVNASNTAVDLAWMRQHATGFDVTIEDQTDALAMIAIQGQTSTQILQPLVQGLELAKLGYYKFGFGTVCGIANMRVSRTGYTGELGYELYIPRAQVTAVWQAVMQAGEAHGLKAIGLGARDTLRLEAGMPLYGHEIDANHDPLSAGLAFGVSFAPEKGEWIGKSALQAIAAAPQWKLVGVKTAGPRVPRQGYGIAINGVVVGEIASGSISPMLDTNIGTAFVPASVDEAHAKVELDIKGKRQEASFCALPFFSRTRK
jgi:aminomethyltransferase